LFIRSTVNYKAVITDLDGTVIDSPGVKVASERMAEAVVRLEAAGVKVCAATGRPESFAMPVLTSMRLTEPCIVAGGTRIINPTTREKLWSCDLSPEQTRAVIHMLQGTEYGVLWNDYVEEDYASGGWPVERFDAYDDTFFIEICYVLNERVPEVVEQFGAIEGLAVTVVLAQREGYRDIHITNQAATKEHAIYELEKLIGVPKEQMIGIGDGHNDIHLFNAVGHKVAMANAVPELKEGADEVIGAVTEEGLAIYFEKLAEEAA
jgi:Cof subfamily protein (haloacid dehalogenase superfamily)